MGLNKSKGSKNSRSGSKTDVLECICGGGINMHTTVVKGKVLHYAQCGKCLNKARKPHQLMMR